MKRFDWTIWIGLFVGVAAIGGGAWIEGLSLNFLWHPTAALIVGGGTLGAGIATAFVATIYGIGIANLLLFPLATRLRARHEIFMKRREEIAAVIIALTGKETPRAIINKFNLQK